MKKNIVALALTACMGATLLAGCGCSSKKSEGSVYWLNFKPEADEALQEIAKDYEKETGVDVKVVTAAEGTYNSTLTAEMDKSNAPTMFVVGNQAAVNTWGDYCVDLKDTDVYKELTTDDFTLYDEDGKACAIGYCYESYGLIVNKTLLKKAGYEVSDIKDFDSLKKIADDIHANADKLGFDAFTSSGMDDGSSWRFSGHLANLPLYYESVADSWSDQPSEIKGTYLDNYKKLWDLYTTDTAADKKKLATDGQYDAEKEFLDGEAVFFQNGSWEYDTLKEQYKDSEMQMIPIYAGVDDANQGLCSGTENCWAVNKNASEADQKATLDFMKWLVTSDKGTTMMAEQFGVIPYKSAQENTNLFIKQGDELREAGKTTVEWTFNLTPNVDDWRAGVVAAMNKYDAGSGSWDDVVTAFVKGWAKQYKAANKK